MNNNQLTELKIDEWIWVIFIVLSVLNIFGDECKKDFIQQQDIGKEQTAKKIFTFTLFISLLIYCYLAYQRYNQLQFKKQTSSLEHLRFFGNILVVIASVIFLYYQVKSTSASNPSID